MGKTEVRGKGGRDALAHYDYKSPRPMHSLPPKLTLDRYEKDTYVKCIMQIPVSSDYYKFSFFPRTICRLNSLPANVAEAPSLVSFKRELLSLSI